MWLLTATVEGCKPVTQRWICAPATKHAACASLEEESFPACFTANETTSQQLTKTLNSSLIYKAHLKKTGIHQSHTKVLLVKVLSCTGSPINLCSKQVVYSSHLCLRQPRLSYGQSRSCLLYPQCRCAPGLSTEPLDVLCAHTSARRSSCFILKSQSQVCDGEKHIGGLWYEATLFFLCAKNKEMVNYLFIYSFIDWSNRRTAPSRI